MERRRSERVPYSGRLTLGGGEGVPLNAEALNISESGVGCRTSEELPEDAQVSLSLTIEEEEERVELPLSAEARVARCDDSSGAGSYELGIEFYELSDEAKQRLSMLVRQLRGQ